MLGFGCRPIDNGGNALWIHCDAVGGDNKTEAFCFLDVEFTLLEFSIQAMVEEALEDLVDMLDMLFVSTVGIYKDIIQIGHTEIV